MAPDETDAQRDTLENERSALEAERSREAAEHAQSKVAQEGSKWERLKGGAGKAWRGASATGRFAHRVSPGWLFIFILAAGFVHWIDIRNFNFNPLDPTRFLFHLIIMILGIFIFSTGNRKQDITRFLFLFFIVMFLGVITRGLHYFLMDAVFATSNEAARLILGTLLNAHLLPVWIIFAITQETVEQTWFTKVLLAVWVIALLLAFYTVVPNIPRSFADVGEWYASLPGEEREQAEGFLESVQEGGVRFWNDLTGGVRRAVVGQIEYAAGDYYTGRVDENREEPLGVYIENLQLASDIFFEDEPIMVWGALKARTLDPNEPINIEISCSSNIGGNQCSTQRVQGDVNPDPTMQDITYRIFGREYQDLSCEFPARTLSSGYRDIRFTAEFDFMTDAYLKVYFIDQDRSRALARANIDPFNEYSIQDRNPIAVYSNGPISIGAGTSEPLVALSPNRDFRFGITFNNRWQGKIKRLKTLVIKIPETMELTRCDQPVAQRACEGDECESGKYTRVWVLNLDSRQLTNITSARTFSCRVHTDDVQATLGGVPLATKYFKVRAEYVYEIEQRIGAQVRQVEGVDISCAAPDSAAGLGTSTPVTPVSRTLTGKVMLFGHSLVESDSAPFVVALRNKLGIPITAAGRRGWTIPRWINAGDAADVVQGYDTVFVVLNNQHARINSADIVRLDQEIKTHGATVVWIGEPPRPTGNPYDGTEEYQWQALREAASQGVTYVLAEDWPMPPSGYSDVSSRDNGLHVTHAGANLWADRLAPLLRPHIPTESSTPDVDPGRSGSVTAYRQTSCDGLADSSTPFDAFFTSYNVPSYGNPGGYSAPWAITSGSDRTHTRGTQLSGIAPGTDAQWAFFCAVAMQCSCPENPENPDGPEFDQTKRCYAGGQFRYGGTRNGFSPCTPFPRGRPYCTSTASSKAPVVGQSVAADDDCFDVRSGCMISIDGGPPREITDTGSGIRGRRFDAFTAEARGPGDGRVSGVHSVQVLNPEVCRQRAPYRGGIP